MSGLRPAGAAKATKLNQLNVGDDALSLARRSRCRARTAALRGSPIAREIWQDVAGGLNSSGLRPSLPR